MISKISGRASACSDAHVPQAGPAECLVPVCLRLSLGVPLLVSSFGRLQHVSAFVALWHTLHLPGAKVVAPAYAVAESCGALLLFVGWQGRAIAGRFAIELLAVITGGAGFIGSHLCARFLREGFEVTATDNFLMGTRRNLDPLRGHPRFSLIPGDVTQPIAVARRVDLILHFASPASPVDYLAHPIHTMKVDSFGAFYTLGLAKAWGACYVLASTSEVYGDPLEHPQREEHWGHVNPVGPHSVYDEAKRFGEALAMAYHRVHGVDSRIARIFNTYGPRMRRTDGRAIPAFITAALDNRPIEVFGTGTPTRSFCYIDDLVEGILRLATHDHLAGEVVNLGHNGECSIQQVARMVRDLAGSRSPIISRPLPQDDPKRRRPDLTKARRLLAYAPRVALEEGLRRTIAWFAGEAANVQQVTDERVAHAVRI